MQQFLSRNRAARPNLPRTAGLALVAALALSACSSIKEVEEFESCGADATSVIAIFDTSADNYDESTDPVILAEMLLQQAEAIQESDPPGILNDPVFQLQNVGVGLLACRSIDDSRIFFLTSRGAEVSRQYDQQEQ